MQKLSHTQIAKLVKRVQQGDPEAFATLYAVTVESQLYFATTFLKDAALAEDVVQEVYFSVYKSIDKLENPKLFVAYLNRICYNTCVSFKRKLVRTRYELDEDALSGQSDESVESNPDDRYLLLEQSSQLQAALAALPDKLRATFLYRNYHEMKISEIAAVMNVSDSTVKRNIKAAIAQLQERLQSTTPNVEKDSDYA